MKKILLIIIFSILITPLYAGPKDKVRDGFISKKNVHPVKNDFNISDPKNKIILIYNHRQNENDMALQSCAWVSMLRNHASLIDQEVKGKKIMDHKQIKKFIMFYERITRNMLKTLNLNANIVVKIDKKHKLKSLKFN